MPKMDGWAVAKQIRLLRLVKRPLLIAVSGYGHEAARRQSYGAGIDLHLVKPVDPAELEKLLRRFQGVVMPEGSEGVIAVPAGAAAGTD
jgi:CheY-like chemotaxis protein